MTPTDFDQQMPLFLRNFENALRSGYNIAQTLDIIARDLPAPAGPEAAQTLAEIKAGTPMPDAFTHWIARRPSPDLDLFVATLMVQLEIGGNLADKLNLLAQIMAKRQIAPHAISH